MKHNRTSQSEKNDALSEIRRYYSSAFDDSQQASNQRNDSQRPPDKCLPTLSMIEQANTIHNGRKAIQITQSVLQKGKQEQESISNILKAINPPVNAPYFNQIGRKSESTGAPQKMTLQDVNAFQPNTFESFKIASNVKSRAPVETHADFTSFNNSSNGRAYRERTKAYADAERQDSQYVTAISNLAQIMTTTTGKAIKQKILETYNQKPDKIEYRRPQLPSGEMQSLRDSEEQKSFKLVVYSGSEMEQESPSRRVSKQNNSEKMQQQLLQQSQSAMKINSRAPDYFDIDESAVNQKVQAQFYTGNSKIKVKSKNSNVPEKSIFVVDRKNAMTSDLLNSNSLFALRGPELKPAINPVNLAVSSVPDVPYFNQINSTVSLPAINRQNPVPSRHPSYEIGKERKTVQTDDIYKKQAKEKDNFNRAYKISQLNALTNKRIKQKLDKIAVEQGITQPVTILAHQPQSKNLRTSFSQQGAKHRNKRQGSQVELSPSPSGDENEVVKQELQTQKADMQLHSQAQKPSLAQKYTLRSQQTENAQQIELKQKLSGVNEILKNLIMDLQRLNPDFLRLTSEQQTAFLVDNMRRVKQGQQPDQSTISYQLQGESGQLTATSPNANMNFLSPMHIINHFNITINHAQMTSKPEPQTPVQKPSSRSGLKFKRQSAGPSGRRKHSSMKPQSQQKERTHETFGSDRENDENENSIRNKWQENSNYQSQPRQKSESRSPDLLDDYTSNDVAPHSEVYCESPEIKRTVAKKRESSKVISDKESNVPQPSPQRLPVASNSTFQPKRLDLSMIDNIVPTKQSRQKERNTIANKEKPKKIPATTLQRLNLNFDETGKRVMKVQSGVKSDETTPLVQVNNDSLMDGVDSNGSPMKVAEPMSAVVVTGQKIGTQQFQSEDASPSQKKPGFTQEQAWGSSNKRAPPNQQIYKEQLKIRLEFFGIDDPDCIPYYGRNKLCKSIRAYQRERALLEVIPTFPERDDSETMKKPVRKRNVAKKIEPESAKKPPKIRSKDLLIIPFEGVLGTFIQIPTVANTTQQEQLFLRPNINETLTQFAENFQIAIIADYEQAYRLRAIRKALKNAPYDKIYQKIGWRHDNFFNIENILKDHQVNETRVVFLTACNFTGQLLTDEPPAVYNLQRAITNHMSVTATPKDDFALMPVALNLESLVIFVVPHLFIELEGQELFRKAELYDLAEVTVTHFGNFATPLLNLQQIAQSIPKAKIKHLKKAETITMTSNQIMGNSLLSNEKHKQDNTLSTDRDSSTEEEKKKRVEEVKLQSDDPTRLQTKFKILTEISDYELFQPITLYLKQFQPLKVRRKLEQLEEVTTKGKLKKNKLKEASLLSAWKENFYLRAFNKIKHSESFNALFFQPERFNREILGRRLQSVMLKIRLKLNKIKHAMKVVNAFYLKKGIGEEDNTNVFLQRQERNEKLRGHMAFQDYMEFNKHYYQEVYEECLVRLPLHPTREQLSRLQNVYKTLYQRLEDLITQKFKTGKDSDYGAAQGAIIKQRLKNAGIEDLETQAARQENPYFSAFTRHVAYVAQQNKPTGSELQSREAQPYNLIILQQNFMTQAPIERSVIVNKPRYKDSKGPRGCKSTSIVDWMCIEQKEQQKQVIQVNQATKGDFNEV